MLNIPEKLLAALGFSKSNVTNNKTSDISKDKTISPFTASAKALLDALRGINEQAKYADDDDDDNNNDYYYYHDYSFAARDKKVLELTPKDAQYIKKIDFSSNSFNSIDYCRREATRLFVAVLRDWLDGIFKKYSIGGSAYIEQFGELVARKEFRYRTGSWNFRDTLKNSESAIFTRVYQFCENVVRSAYHHGRQLTPRMPYNHKEVISRLNDLDTEFKALVAKHAAVVKPADEETEIELNRQNKSRWKIYFDQFCNTFDTLGIDQFVAKTMDLHKINKENTSNSQIFFEAAKFLVAYEPYRVWALKMYVYYCYCEPIDGKLKPMAAKIRKAMLPNATAEKFFVENIQNQTFRKFSQADFFALIDRDFAAAVAPPARKKIVIDHKAVADTKAAHNDTVALLNNILADEEVEMPIIVPKKEPKKAEITPKENQQEADKKEAAANQKYKAELGLSAVQIALLDLFADNNLALSSEAIKQVARNYKTAHNSLIDSINEACFELLDDVLIEEDSPNNYTINSSYFRQINHD